MSCATLFLLAPPLLAASPAVLESRAFRFTLDPETGICTLTDKETGTVWKQPESASRFGRISAWASGKLTPFDLTRCSVEEMPDGGIAALFRPLPEKSDATVRVLIRPTSDKRGFALNYVANQELMIDSASFLNDLLGATADGNGYVAIPAREGLLIPATSGIDFTHRFDTSAYEGCHMQMAGLVEKGAAVLISWDDPYVAVDVASRATNAANGNQRLALGLNLRKTASSFEVRLLGKGDYVDIAKAYRGIARGRGLLVPWSEKLKGNPERAKLFGAINYKLWSTLDRRMNEESTQELSKRVNWTFDEAAQVAEHLKKDLKLDRVLFSMGGWIHRGYDNQHPDILPTAPECGGDAAFTNCAKRIMDLGYVFCLHDNYQDIYRDSPSWNERYVMKTADGKLTKGGHWAGGVAYLTCSKMALELAQRPQNLPAIKQLCGANSYFIDTTYASGLQECFDPGHPLTRADDLKWKIALSDYAREVFGIFGSECGREWAIPHSDFFEGITGVSGGYYHDAKLTEKLGATVIPLFELVYRDCIAAYGKYGYDPKRAARYVLHHIALGRTLNHHNIPQHLYWKNPALEAGRLPLTASIASLEQTGPRHITATWQWEVNGPVKVAQGDWRVFVHFTDNSGAIRFQADYEPSGPPAKWNSGRLRHGPFVITVPDGVSGTYAVRMGLFESESGQRALLQGRDNNERSYLVGRVRIEGSTIQYQPLQPSPIPEQTGGDPALFVRSENGWTDGLHPVDKFVKNTYEILSPLNEITSTMEMSDHEFLNPERSVQRTTFGQGPDHVIAIVNAGSTDFPTKSRFGRNVILPPYGFLIEAPTFVAAHVREWNRTTHPEGVMFTLRSQDGKDLTGSRNVRQYTAFGKLSRPLPSRTPVRMDQPPAN